MTTTTTPAPAFYFFDSHGGLYAAFSGPGRFEVPGAEPFGPTGSAVPAKAAAINGKPVPDGVGIYAFAASIGAITRHGNGFDRCYGVTV